MRQARRLLTLCATLILAAHAAIAANWPQWRGLAATGVTKEKGFPVTWGGKDNANILWKAELPKNDDSPSSPIVWGNRVYVATTLREDHRVTCYQRADGKMLWSTPVEKGPWKKTDQRGGWGAPTPATDGERVYALFGTAILAALNCADGKKVWSRPLEHYSFDVAMGSSPIVYEGSAVLFSGLTKKDSNITAFERETGKVKWKLELPKIGFGHSTPAITAIAGKPRLIVAANRRSTGILGVDPAKGELLWSAPGDGETASPAIGANMAYCDSGRGGGGYALDLTKTVGASEVVLKWKLSSVNQDLGSPIIVGDHIYRMGSGGWLNCLELATGKKVCSKKLDGAYSWVSPVATADGLIYFACAGRSYVVRSGPTCEILAVNDLPDRNHASPAFSDGTIFLKGRKHLYCIGRK